jgi:hypothetical protein
VRIESAKGCQYEYIFYYDTMWQCDFSTLHHKTRIMMTDEQKLLEKYRGAALRFLHDVYEAATSI